MAIVHASMAEEILSRSEKAVIRGIYRASQLAEAKMALVKTTDTLNDLTVAKADANPLRNQVESLKAYLDNAISNALIATKVPSISPIVKESPGSS